MRLGAAGLLALAVLAREPWSPEQATGAPDTPEAEDAPTAWTPLEPDAGEEWLVVRFERLVPIAEVRVRESLNPGAVRRVSAVLEDGASSVLWQGEDPTAQAPADLVVPVEAAVSARAVLVELDTRRRSGWNAIDAVELVGRDGSRQWATEAAASSAYASVGGILAGEFSPEARLFADEALGVKISAPGFWIRANPALLEAPGTILRAWTRDGSATIVLTRLQTRQAWDPEDLQSRTAAALEAVLGAEVQAREMHSLSGLKAMGLVAAGPGEGGGGRTMQHWVVLPRKGDLLVFLLSSAEGAFSRDDRTFLKMLASAVIGDDRPAH
ncbi:MAG: hypothetical protein ACJ75H_16395 [Thermoanaerobaculia bacterium]